MTNSESTNSEDSVRRGKYAAESTISEQELRERIAQRAYELYEKRGQTHGGDLEDWLEAERLVLAQLKDDRHSKIKMPRKRSNRSKEDKATEGR
jgi:hypothetical protein